MVVRLCGDKRTEDLNYHSAVCNQEPVYFP